MKRESPEPPGESFYLQGLRAGIAARTASEPEAAGSKAGSAALPDGEAPEPKFNLASKLAECAVADRSPDATERLLLDQRGFLYLGPERDGFSVHIDLPGGMIDTRQLLSLAVMSQQFANGSVEFDDQGSASLQVVSMCDAPVVLRQIEATGLKTAHMPVEIPAPRGRLLSSEMVSLAEQMKGKEAFALREVIPFP